MSVIIPNRKTRAELPSHGVFPYLVQTSTGVGEDANAITDYLKQNSENQTLSMPILNPVSAKRKSAVARTLAEKLYDSLADTKIRTSQVAMHLDESWRKRLFTQLDDLLDADDWHKEDEPVVGASFGTFLRMIVYQAPERRPALGVSNRGNLIAAWTSGADRLTLEFLPEDLVRWVLSCEIDGEIERAAGESPVRRLPLVMSAYQPDRWFSNAKTQNTT